MILERKWAKKRHAPVSPVLVSLPVLILDQNIQSQVKPPTEESLPVHMHSLDSPVLKGVKAPPPTPASLPHDAHSNNNDVHALVETMLNRYLEDIRTYPSLGESMYAPHRSSPRATRLHALNTPPSNGQGKSDTSNWSPDLASDSQRLRDEPFNRMSFAIASRSAASTPTKETRVVKQHSAEMEQAQPKTVLPPSSTSGMQGKAPGNVQVAAHSTKLPPHLRYTSQGQLANINPHTKIPETVNQTAAGIPAIAPLTADMATKEVPAGMSGLLTEHDRKDSQAEDALAPSTPVESRSRTGPPTAQDILSAMSGFLAKYSQKPPKEETSSTPPIAVEDDYEDEEYDSFKTQDSAEDYEEEAEDEEIAQYPLEVYPNPSGEQTPRRPKSFWDDVGPPTVVETSVPIIETSDAALPPYMRSSWRVPAVKGENSLSPSRLAATADSSESNIPPQLTWTLRVPEHKSGANDMFTTQLTHPKADLQDSSWKVASKLIPVVKAPPETRKENMPISKSAKGGVSTDGREPENEQIFFGVWPQTQKRNAPGELTKFSFLSCET